MNFAGDLLRAELFFCKNFAGAFFSCIPTQKMIHLICIIMYPHGRQFFMSDLLRPLSFEKLMALLLEEHSADGTIFGVKDAYKAGRSRLPIFGLRIENPVGPAAGPVTQTAQGIIAA